MARTAAAAIQEVGRSCPDLLIVDLNLPGLSGKDLMVALNSQGIEVPVIVLSQARVENDILQAFRLGAADYLLWPARDAEVISAVERVLGQVRARRERERLERQLKETTRELQRRLREMTTLLALAKAITSIADRKTRYGKIVQGAVYISEADYGWLLLRSEGNQRFSLHAQHNVPSGFIQPGIDFWEDGLSALVGLSGESLSIHGEAQATSLPLDSQLGCAG
jgi:YesN/AraC family two-component response regulator